MVLKLFLVNKKRKRDESGRKMKSQYLYISCTLEKGFVGARGGPILCDLIMPAI